MITADYNYQYIDWSHDPVPGEPFEHIGNLVTNVITPSVTIGLSNYFNLSFKQVIGIRRMDWMGSDTSYHHRDESSLNDFTNAHGSLFGDSNIILRYLLTNTGSQKGSRIFLGLGLTIPSNSVLTSNPYLDDDNGIALDEHRHFSLSDGSYKLNYELQYYLKSKPTNPLFPIFYGVTLNYLHTLTESEYGYLPGSTLTGIASFLFTINSTKKLYPKGISLGMIYLKQSEGFWEQVPAPIGETSTFIPTLGLIWNLGKGGSLSLNLRHNQDEPISEDALNNKSKSYEFSIGYRKTLDYTIPWLYW